MLVKILLIDIFLFVKKKHKIFFLLDFFVKIGYGVFSLKNKRIKEGKYMLSHKRIWRAIDRIAKDAGLTPSGLAKKAGLDPTSFNKSKRIGSGGKLRWPSTESLYKLLKVLGKDLSYFSSLVEPDSISEIKLIGSLQTNLKGFCECDENSEWESVTFPRTFNKDSVAIKINGYSLEPIYRNGDTLIISKKEALISEDDRVVLKTTDNELIVKRFIEKDETNTSLRCLEKEGSTSKVPNEKIEWIGKIIWVSQ